MWRTLYVKMTRCNFRFLPVLVEMGIATLCIDGPGDLGSGVRLWGFHPWPQVKSHDYPVPRPATCLLGLQSGYLPAFHSSVFLHTRIPRAFLMTMKYLCQYPH
jgi:hypothetical protein